MRTELSQSGVCELELRLYIAINITYYSLDWEITWLCLSCLKDILMQFPMDGFIQVSPIWLNVITVVWDFKSNKKRWLHVAGKQFL